MSSHYLSEATKINVLAGQEKVYLSLEVGGGSLDFVTSYITPDRNASAALRAAADELDAIWASRDGMQPLFEEQVA